MKNKPYETKTLVRFSVGVHIETRGQDAILSYCFNTDEIAGGLVGRSCGGGRRHVELIK